MHAVARISNKMNWFVLSFFVIVRLTV